MADNALPDGKTAEMAVQALREAKGKTFFLACGFLKPHLPFVAPKKYFDYHPMDKIHLPDNYAPPKDVPALALTEWGELRTYSDMPKKGPLTEFQARQLIRAYHASASYPMRRSANEPGANCGGWAWRGTRSCAVGDRGASWRPVALVQAHQLRGRGPRAADHQRPGQKHAAPARTPHRRRGHLPPLCELAGLPMPDGLEGTSLKPVMDNPERPWKAAAFSQYPRGKAMGYSMRTPRYRYTEWLEPGIEPRGVELYDHVADPGETANLAAHPEKRVLAAGLSKRLKAGWRAALPRGVRAV